MRYRINNYLDYEGEVFRVVGVSLDSDLTDTYSVEAYGPDGKYLNCDVSLLEEIPLDVFWIECLNGKYYEGPCGSKFIRFDIYPKFELRVDKDRGLVGPSGNVVSSVDQLQNLFYYYSDCKFELL